ncbi:MAG: NF038104 family lipoprotein [Candidatus Saccharibacteria bacterium]|nr:NF038104 family lipoprotein [Moraxellaceae bacterium]
MISFAKKTSLAAVIFSSLLLTGCITDIVTVPLGLAYDVTKYTVKGTVAVVGGTVDLLTPDGDDKKADKKKEEDKKD